MKQAYVRAMDAVHNACLVVAGAGIVVVTLIIPWGVFTRYVLNEASSWPEPMAVLLMIWISFLSAAVCYREYLHIAVGVLLAAVTGTNKLVLGWMVELCMLAANFFMMWYGTKLVQTTWHQSISDFPVYSVGMSYLPVPIGGAVIVLFAIERLWTGALFVEPSPETISTVTTE